MNEAVTVVFEPDAAKALDQAGVNAGITRAEFVLRAVRHSIHQATVTVERAMADTDPATVPTLLLALVDLVVAHTPGTPQDALDAATDGFADAMRRKLPDLDADGLVVLGEVLNLCNDLGVECHGGVAGWKAFLRGELDRLAREKKGK